jgi:hypothetical protein
MNKNINHAQTFQKDLPDIERREHGLKKAPTKAQMQKMEMKEHGFKSPPSMSQIMGVERKEHLRPGGKVVIGKGYKGQARAK